MTTVREALLEARQRHRRIYFRPGLGNAGDALISAGFYALAEELALDHVEVPGAHAAPPDLSADDLLVLMGGGWLTSHWDFGPRLIDTLTSRDAPLLLLPQSLLGHEETLRRLRPQDTLFTRERYSHDFARSLDLRCRVELDHDMALHVDPERLPARLLPRWPGLALARNDARRFVALGMLRAQAARHPDLAAWRTDVESDGSHGARWRSDVSLVANFGTADRRAVLTSTGWLFRALSWFRRVETDRLHVGVAAALLGMPVQFHANAYHKVRGVYEYSLRDDPRFAGLVTFVDAA